MLAYLLVNLLAVFFAGVLLGALAATLACWFVGARRRKRAERVAEEAGCVIGYRGGWLDREAYELDPMAKMQHADAAAAIRKAKETA